MPSGGTTGKYSGDENRRRIGVGMFKADERYIAALVGYSPGCNERDGRFFDVRMEILDPEEQAIDLPDRPQTDRASWIKYNWGETGEVHFWHDSAAENGEEAAVKAPGLIAVPGCRWSPESSERKMQVKMRLKPSIDLAVFLHECYQANVQFRFFQPQRELGLAGDDEKAE